MKFKSGDLCEVHDACCAQAKQVYAGKECTLLGARPSTGLNCGACGAAIGDAWRCEGPAAADHPSGTVLVPERFLRLKRPPSWDGWIHDTREVRNETPETVPA